MKKLAFIAAAIILGASAWAQTKVDAKKLGKTLESNKAPSAEFVSDVNISGMEISADGKVRLPSVTTKAVLVTGIESENLKERIAHIKNPAEVTFASKDVSGKIKTYEITKIAGLETVAQYKERLEQEEKQKAEEARIRYEKERLSNLTKQPVQVVLPQGAGIPAGEQSWLPGQLQDKIKSNFQEYLGMRTVVDAKAEKELLKIQAGTESSSHDEATAVEFGKITSAKFAVFPTLRKTSNGYTLNIDFTDLTTGEQLASALSKEYTKSEYLYGTTGAIDELTLKIAEKLNLPLSEITKSLLTSGSADFSVDAQLALAKQNEEAYRRQQSNLDAEIAKLSSSTDINAVQNKKKLEAEKALIAEKQNAEKKRQQELAEQKKRAAEDEKLESERSIALKTQRDQMAKDAAKKAAEVRKLKMEKQGVLGQINVIESKKKALVEIRQGVENRSQELYDQLVKDRESEESRIRNKSYSTVELGSDGTPTEQAKQRRENQVIKSNEDLTNKFFVDCDTVKKATAGQDASLLAEIRGDQKTLTAIRTVSSMGDELKVSYGKYEGSKNGWNAYLSLYSDGVLLYTDNFIVNYEALSGKKAPDMATELNDAVIEEYTNNVDMYNSLLTRGDPIIYFEIDYNVTAEGDEKPSQYKFNFSKIRVINTVSGKVTQTSSLAKVEQRTMKPEWDLREIVGIVHDEWIRQIVARKNTDYENEQIYSFLKGSVSLEAIPQAEKKILDSIRESLSKLFTMKKVPGKNFKIMTTEVTQKLYTSIMGSNPSYYEGDNNPVERVSWYDAIYFCNKLSEKYGFTPVYSVNGKTDVTTWNYTPHNGESIRGEVTQNTNANGFRLPTIEEWVYAAKGGQNYTYSGSNNLNEVGWCSRNSGDKTHPVAQKKANDYGLYDMSGNVYEWCWDVDPDYSYCRCSCGCSYFNYGAGCEVDFRYNRSADAQYNSVGFRIVCSGSK